jgi:hypothetical protein
VNDIRTTLIPLSLGDPEVGGIVHDLSKDGATEEDHVLSARRILNLKLELLLLESGRKTGVHGGTTREHNVLVESRTKIDISILDHVEEHVVKSGLLRVDKTRLEENLGGLETLHANLDLTTIGKNEVLSESSSLKSKALLDIHIVANVAALLLDKTDSLEISGTVEVVTTSLQELDKIASDVTASDIKTADEVSGAGVVPDGDDVGHTITGVDDDTVDETLGVEDEHGLDLNLGSGETISLEHVLEHLLLVLDGVERGLG